MFKKGTEIIKVKSELKKSKSLEEFLPTQLTIKNAFHNDVLLKAKLETCHDLITSCKLNNNFEDKLSISTQSIKKGEEIEQIIKESKQFVIQKAFNTAKYAFKRALRHYCFYEIIEEDKDKITIIFLPITTSDKKILCGIQKFDKTLMHSNEINSFYITRLLFQKTMTRLDYDNWLNSTKFKYEGDLNVRKIIFEKIQQDLDINQYSVLKDSDILEPTTDAFTKELPLMKFKFTDLEF